MKFIHTSDWHIGRQFHAVSLLEDQRYVLEQLLAYIEQEAVDAVLIAGDIYDRSVPPADAVALLDEVLSHICVDLGVPVILISGNHDSAERLSFGARQLKQAGLHIMGDLALVTEPVILRARKRVEGAHKLVKSAEQRVDIAIESNNSEQESGQGQLGFELDAPTSKPAAASGKPLEQVAFYGIPYCDPEAVRHATGSQVKSYDEAHTLLVEQALAVHQAQHSELPSVLLSHCFVDGSEESDSERPLAIGGSDRVSYQPCLPFDYVALGHLHAPQYRGEQHIRYSGSLMKYSFSEQHQRKGVTLVELSDQGAETCHLPLKPLRDMRIVEGYFEDLLAQGKTDPKADDYLLVRLLDKHAILEPMAKLREVYPNVLQLEKPGMLGETTEQAMNRERLKRGELEMFRDFFEQVHGQSMSEAQDQCMQALIQAVHKSEGAA